MSVVDRILGRGPEDIAKKHVRKGREYVSKNKWDKALIEFEKAAEQFLKAGQFEEVERNYSRATKCSLREKNFKKALENKHRAAILRLSLDDLIGAAKYYAANEKLASQIRLYQFALLYLNLNGLCYLVAGNYTKFSKCEEKTRKYRSLLNERTEDHNVISKIWNSITKRDADELGMAKKVFRELKLSPQERRLVENGITLAEKALRVNLSLTVERKEVGVGEHFGLVASLNSPEKLSLMEFTMKYPRNMAMVTDFALPRDSVSKVKIDAKAKGSLPGKILIGPMKLLCKDRAERVLMVVSDQIELSIHPPESIVEIQFSLHANIVSVGEEVEATMDLSNMSKGEATNIVARLDIPEEIEIIQGTIEKRIHALAPGERMSFLMVLQPNNVGDFQIDGKVTFDGPKKSNQTNQAIPVELKVERRSIESSPKG
ncbi:MAG: hypothetical protein ACFFBS_04860 [Promethearchaeota archaeon]